LDVSNVEHEFFLWIRAGECSRFFAVGCDEGRDIGDVGDLSGVEGGGFGIAAGVEDAGTTEVEVAEEEAWAGSV
jgi:hypothetical protein